MPIGKVYLIPMLLHPDATLETMPSNIENCINKCSSFFVEDVKTTRRFFKKINKNFPIENYSWHIIHKLEEETVQAFSTILLAGKNVGIVSEAGCVGIADPGQLLINKAQQLHAKIVPMIGPNSIILALMASGLNGQHFCFNGYLPILSTERKKAIKQLEDYSNKNKSSQIFIETPFRNQSLLQDILSTCKENTQLCIALDLTSPNEIIKTKKIIEWRKNIPQIHKKLAIFIIQSNT
ncbi:MAG: SAM-dependent methyltransferase [Sediminibacterium sp.]|nr:SAM-dependent methyltransferase [Sediminibacterium sp.]